MSVTGSEESAKEELCSFFSEPFDEYIPHRSGSHIFVKRCNKENAPRLMIDTHFDEIGMAVTGIEEDGFLRVCSMGGIDRRSLPASVVTVYGKEAIQGVIVSKSPHLQAAGESKKAPKMDEILIDTGYTKEKLSQIVEIGTPVGFSEKCVPLGERRIVSRGLDNKASCAAAYICARDIKKEDMCCDLYVVLSSREEVGGSFGAVSTAYTINPCIAVITDVTFAASPGVGDWESGKLGGGPVISLSAVTDKRLTNDIRHICEENHISYGITVDATDTGTNATMISLTGDGIPTAVVSIPIRSMHTYSETADISDIENTARLFELCIKEEKLYVNG